jgi:Fe-S cluster biogenesis protein NfuA
MSWLDRLANAWGAGDDSGGSEKIAGDPRRIAEVQAVLDELRPMIRADAGDIELVSIEDGWVTVRLRGACGSCHASDMTVHGALEPRLKSRFDWVAGVRAI